MSLIIDMFNPCNLLPVQVTAEGFEIAKTHFKSAPSNDNYIILELSDDRESMPELEALALDKYFPNLLDNAIDDEIEHIQFYK